MWAWTVGGYLFTVPLVWAPSPADGAHFTGKFMTAKEG